METRRLLPDQFKLKPTLIKVMYKDGKMGKVDAERLDDLIQSKKIKKFQRSGQWVTIGVDPIRKTREDNFVIPKREKNTKGSKREK